MKINNFSPDYSVTEQLKKYAEDLAKTYKTAKQNQKNFEAASLQLTKYADDLNKTVLELKSTYRDLQEAYLDTIHRLALVQRLINFALDFGNLGYSDYENLELI